MSREVHVRFWERVRVKLPRATRFPLYRLNEIFARMGADIPDSTLVDWCGRAMKVLAPLIERIEADVMASDLLHADDTPIRVLDKSLRDRGLGKGPLGPRLG